VFLDARTFYVVVSAREMKDTTISLKIERALKAKLLALARQENRSLSNFVEKLLKAEVAKYESKHGRHKSE
jgi:predicted HicB family RNase H-like nuclease